MTEPSILICDIGSGTQDVLLYQPGRPLENCSKFVLPAPARRVAERIAALGKQGRPVYLHGTNMGGGFYRTLKRFLEQGGKAAAHPDAAFSLADDPAAVEALGVAVTPHAPEGCVPVHLSDFDPGFWSAFLSCAGLPVPDLVLACAQDHGFHPGRSNRIGRFELWRRFLLEAGGDPAALLFARPPVELTRLAALQASIGGGPVSDSGAAACLGALFDPEVAALARMRGVTVLNVGNSHMVAFLVYDGRVYGVYEHHTGLRDAEALLGDLAAFGRGELAMQAVFDSGGHGCMRLDAPEEAGDFAPLVVLGPQRGLLAGHKAMFIAPGGDMMLAGCFGLLHAYRLQGKID